MSEAKFTKGKWVLNSNSHGDILFICPESDYVICEIRSAIGVDRHNAKLIKTAPEMYKALEELLSLTLSLQPADDHSNYDPEADADIIRARAVLAKARGE